MKGKSTIDTPIMKGKRTGLTKEGKKEETTSNQPSIVEINLGIRQRVDTWIKRTRFWCNIPFKNKLLVVEIPMEI